MRLKGHLLGKRRIKMTPRPWRHELNSDRTGALCHSCCLIDDGATTHISHTLPHALSNDSGGFHIYSCFFFHLNCGLSGRISMKDQVTYNQEHPVHDVLMTQSLADSAPWRGVPVTRGLRSFCMCVTHPPLLELFDVLLLYICTAYFSAHGLLFG